MDNTTDELNALTQEVEEEEESESDHVATIRNWPTPPKPKTDVRAEAMRMYALS